MKTSHVLASILAIAFLLASCGPAAPATPETQPLRIAYTDWPGDYIVLLAQELGYFSQYGVEVIPVHYESFSSAFPDLATNRIDGINIVPIDLLPIIQDDNVRIVMVTDCSDGADQIVASAEIQSIADLRGKRIGVSTGTFGEFLVREMLESGGMTTADVTLVDIGPESVPDAIPGQIDAGHTWEPHTSQAEALGEHILFTSAETPGLLPDVFAMRAEIVENRPDDVRNFVSAWLDAAEWWIANPAEGSQVIATAIGGNPDDISLDGIKIYTAEDNRLTFTENPGTDASSIYYVIRQNLTFSVESGYITVAPHLETIINPSFLP